ncbi:hypothetical protein JD969_13215 [Planctomycetota bacterium]|nr:hypothetical protein JD969_13215 [Planctomycetota bacterium]
MLASLTTEDVTLFALPKAFVGHSAVIQENAISSWVKMGYQVLLLGRDEGIAAAAKRLGVEHVEAVEETELGTPLLSSAFRIARDHVRTKYMGYINADIMLTHGVDLILPSLQGDFVCVGQRTDVDVEVVIDLDDDEACFALVDRVHQEGRLHPVSGIDYFLLPRESKMCMLPDFAVGRPGWDNWFLDRAQRLSLPVIDLTGYMAVIHQNHDYGHIKKQRGSGWDNPETDMNREIAGGRYCDIGSAGYRVNEDGEVFARWSKLARMHYRILKHGECGVFRRMMHGLKVLLYWMRGKVHDDVIVEAAKIDGERFVTRVKRMEEAAR